MAPLRKAHPANAAPVTRRAHGTLESAVLAILWKAGRPLSPAEVREHLTAQGESRGQDPGDAAELAYTTVVTILTRLAEKGALTRARDGRAYRYAPVADEAGLAARRLTAMLDTATDRQAVLSRFVEDLSDHDERLLRDLLDTRPQQPPQDADPSRRSS